MRVSLIQMNVTDSKAANLSRAAALSERAEGADLIMLPEMFCCPYSGRAFGENAEPFGGAVTDALREIAIKRGACVIGGSMPELDGGKIFNTSFVFDKNGGLIARHRKAHLFDVDIEGGQRFLESGTLSKGDGATVFRLGDCRVGLAVCFDIRFSSFINAMRADILAVPAAFNMTTGPLHWELLFRARAVDGQCFALGCAPARDEGAPYVSYAHSIAVDPWGKVIADAGVGETVTSVLIDTETVGKVRRQIPIGL